MTELRRLTLDRTKLGADSNDLLLDAWGRQKIILDHSVFHGMWTFGVSNKLWEEYSVSGSVYTPLATSGTLATSVGGALTVSSGTTVNDGCLLRSKRSPRYQPNRGHLYSTAVILASPNTTGTRRFGLFTERNGVYFELVGFGSSWSMYVCRKTAGTLPVRVDITALLPVDFTPMSGHLYDIQFQWRGVGNYYFYIDQQLIYTDINLGIALALTIENPALPVAYEAIAGTATAVTIAAGCVDITSEGGDQNRRQFASISTGTVFSPVTDTGTAVLAVYSPRTTDYNGTQVPNTRDIIANKLTSWCRDEAALQAYVATDVAATNLAGLTWTALPDSPLLYSLGGDATALDTAFQLDKASMGLLFNEWEDIEVKNVVTNPDDTHAPFSIAAGDILVIVIQSVAGVNDDAVATIYLSEEI